MKKNIIIIILIILLLGVTIFALKQNKTIKKYTEGFDIIGTYTTSISNQTDYFVFTKGGKAYHYQPSRKIIKGTYRKTDYSNIYLLVLKDNSQNYIILDKDALIYIENDNLTRYTKLSTGEIYNDVESP